MCLLFGAPGTLYIRGHTRIRAQEGAMLVTTEYIGDSSRSSCDPFFHESTGVLHA